jgi:DNA-binding GntR family transcriptional regulator
MNREDVRSTIKQPRHQVVAEELISLISRGEYQLGDRLPTEEELCSRYGLARGTIRQALERLVQLGMVERRPGRTGTQVVATQPVVPYTPFASTTSDVATLMSTTQIVRPETFEMQLDAETAKRLGVRSGTKWHVLRGVRVQRNRPELALCWSEHFFRENHRPAPHQVDLQLDALKGMRIEQTIRADVLDESLAARLDSDASAALIVRRRVIDRRERVLNVGIYTHPADRYEMTATFTGDQEP